VAADEVEVLEIGHEPVKRLFESNPELVASLSRVIGERRSGLSFRSPDLPPTADGPAGILILIMRFFWNDLILYFPVCASRESGLESFDS
jgi:hypothetical protein